METMEVERSGKATVYKNGLTEQSMKGIGTTTRQKDKEHFGMLKVIYMLENSKLIKQMDMAHIHMLTEVAMKVNG